jgi:hypothetical protein
MDVLDVENNGRREGPIRGKGNPTDGTETVGKLGEERLVALEKRRREPLRDGSRGQKADNLQRWMVYETD